MYLLPNPNWGAALTIEMITTKSTTINFILKITALSSKICNVIINYIFQLWETMNEIINEQHSFYTLLEVWTSVLLRKSIKTYWSI